MSSVSLRKNTYSPYHHSKRDKKQGKFKFTPEEDQQLIKLVNQYGTDAWLTIVDKMPWRNERQVRDRWFYYLSPDLNKGPWTEDEDQLLISKVKEFGPSWVYITQFFKNRTDVQIKNRWNVLCRKINFRSDFFDQISSENTDEEPVQKITEQTHSLEDVFKAVDFNSIPFESEMLF